MDYGDLKFDGGKRFDPSAFATDAFFDARDKKEGRKKLGQNLRVMEELQQKLYADGRRGLLVVLQAMDAAGKDGTVRHVFSGLNPQGVKVSSFKQPSHAELAQDYLWRIHKEVPARGMIGIFNRSHYEDVLVGRVLSLPKTQNLPPESLKSIWKNRYRQITDFERYLTENGITVIKFFLHISKDEQRRRLLARLDEPAKNWKFETGDLATRNRWDDYMAAYKECVNHTATNFAPWFVIPADHKWFARLAVSEIVMRTMKKMNPKYPAVGEAQQQELEKCRALLQDFAGPFEGTV